MAKYDYIRGNTKFVNPYNFVRIDESKKEKKSDSEGQNKRLVSGVLHCSFVTKTPLAVPDVEFKTKDSENKKHYRYPFYTINGVPSVPGSSIRGMIRSMYETLTDSCYVTLSNDESITARTSLKKREAFKQGILIKEGEDWVLYSAKRYNVPIGKKFSIGIDDKGRYIKHDGQQYRMGESVSIKFHQEESKGKNIKKLIVDKISKTDSSRFYLYVGEPIKDKKNESVFEKQEKIDLPVDEVKKLMNGLINSVSIYQNSSINKKIGKEGYTGYKNFEQAKKNGAICVWYKEIDGRYYLSMAAIGRKAYNNTVNDMVGSHRNPCEDRNKMCPACKLFGMSKGDGYGSKIRITDAYVQGEYSLLGDVCLKELGSPRTGYYPFYTSNGKEYDEQGVTIAGRKYYWHIPKACKDKKVYESSEKTERNATMELMDVGNKFIFDVYYDNITLEQLNEIKWVLELPEEGGRLMHKLGHGKPLGLGSIKISIDSEYRRVFDGDNYIVSHEKDDELAMPSRIDKDAWKQISVICNFDTMKDKDVRYPYIEPDPSLKNVDLSKNDFAAHQWFTSNKDRKKDSEKPMTLGNLKQEQGLELKVYIAKEIKKNCNSDKNKANYRGGYNKRRY